MKTRNTILGAMALTALLAGGSLQLSAPAHAAAADVPLAAEVIRPPEGLTPTTAKYTLTEPSSLYVSWFMWGGKVGNGTDQMKAGTSVDVIANVNGQDWVLVGRNGTGIGYLPLSVLKKG